MIRKLTEPADTGYVRPNDSLIYQPLDNAEDYDNETEVHLQKYSLRYRRKQFTWAVTAFVIGSALILFQSPIRNEVLAPGPLTSNHAQLLNGLGADRCASCHTAANDSFVQWVKSAFMRGLNVQACQSDLCMKCHRDSIDENLAIKPHNVDRQTLESISDNLSFLSVSNAARTANSRFGDVECSTCHREHHGQEDLTRITDQQCQTCHQSNYHSFETDHLEFAGWPQVQRQRIAFDHVSHGYKHFPESEASFDCKSCHVDGDFKNVMKLASFEQSCAICHEQRIESRIGDGIQLVSLPMLDLDVIKAQKLSVGTWPVNASGDFDGKVSGVMRILLFSDKQAREILERRSPAFEFSDIDPDSSEDVEDAVGLAWSIKQLMYDLATRGTAELRKRMDLAFERSLQDHEFDVLSAGLDAGVFARAANLWLPGLASEIPRRGIASAPQAVKEVYPSVADRIQNEPPLLFVENQQEDLLAPNPLSKLMDGTGMPVRDLNPPATANNQNQENRDPTESGSTQIAKQKIEPAQSAWAADIPDSDLLAKNPLGNFSRSGAVASSNNQSARPIDSGNRSLQPNSENLPTNRTRESEVVREFADRVQNDIRNDSEQQPQGFQVESIDERFVSSARRSGWLRNDRMFQISYRPEGHADQFVAALMNVVAGTPEADSKAAVAKYFQKMTSESSVGACNDCHTVDQTDSIFKVNWRPEYRDPAIRSFTNFSHGPHLLQTELADCTSCHAMNEELANAHTFAQFDSTNVISNFAAIRKSNCTSCHNESGAGNGCTQCHDYHVGARKLLSD